MVFFSNYCIYASVGVKTAKFEAEIGPRLLLAQTKMGLRLAKRSIMTRVETKTVFNLK